MPFILCRPFLCVADRSTSGILQLFKMFSASAEYAACFVYSANMNMIVLATSELNVVHYIYLEQMTLKHSSLHHRCESFVSDVYMDLVHY